ncbi:MAG: hypothetical protein ACQ5SW_08360 [Sphaerochaetaceae bacterium]
MSITSAKVNQTAEQMLKDSMTEFNEYKNATMARKRKVIEDTKWFKSQYWDLFRNETTKGKPEPTTNYLMSNIINKHADMMDGYPKGNYLPKEAQDEELAETLTKIMPEILRRNKFKNVYDDEGYVMLLNGYNVFSTLWDEDMNQLGEIVIKGVDILNFFPEPGIRDLQDSKSIYVVKLIDSDKLRSVLQEKNPHAVPFVGSNKVIDIKEYPTIDDVDTSKMTAIIDRYYIKGGKLHLFKFIEGAPLFWSEDREMHTIEVTDPVTGTPLVDRNTGQIVKVYQFENGLYKHGKYPFVINRLLPEPGSIYGIGLVDIMKNPQMYIDKFDQIILDNLGRAGKNRYFSSRQGNVNMTQFTDLNEDIVDVQGEINDKVLRQIETKQLDAKIIAYREKKIDEIKEISNTNEFSRGEASGGVTAYRAIALMQQASNKVSRAMMMTTYEAYRQLMEMTIENVAQFYTMERTFRITNTDGGRNFVQFNNKNMQPRENPITRQMMKVEFDIDIVPEQDNPFMQEANNELAMSFYSAGFFHPDKAQEALGALDMMEFQGKDRIMKKIKENLQVMQMLQQVQQENMMLRTIVQQTTGQDMGIQMQNNQQQREAGQQNGTTGTSSGISGTGNGTGQDQSSILR